MFQTQTKNDDEAKSAGESTKLDMAFQNDDNETRDKNVLKNDNQDQENKENKESQD